MEERSEYSLGPYLNLKLEDAKIFKLKELKNIKKGDIIRVISGSPVYIKYKGKSWTKEDPLFVVYNTLNNLSIKRFSFFLDYCEKRGFISSTKKEKLDKKVKKLDNLFLNLKIKKPVAVPVNIRGNLKPIIAHRMLFSLVNLNKELTKFIIDNGVGNLNAMGFGFLNLNKTKE